MSRGSVSALHGSVKKFTGWDKTGLVENATGEDLDRPAGSTLNLKGPDSAQSFLWCLGALMVRL